MPRYLSFSLLAVLMFAALSGCARKPLATGDNAETAAAIVPTESLVVEDTTASTVQEAAAENIPETSRTNLVASDGRVLESVYFEFDSYVLTPAARTTLQNNAAWLRINPEKSLTIEGHCDERGSDEYNLALGERRAKAVGEYLTSLGVAVDRLTLISYGEEMPAVIGYDETAWQKNRRAEFN